MIKNPPSTRPDFDETWRRMESLVDEVAQSAKSAASPADFYAELLQRTVTALAPAGGAVWSLDSRGQLQRIDLIGSPKIDSLTQRPVHRESIHKAFQNCRDASDNASDAGVQRWQAAQSSATDETLISCLAPVVVEAETLAVLELVLAGDTPSSSRENVEHVLAALADVSVDFHREDQLRVLRQRVAAWDAAQAFSDCVHRRLDLDETCYAIANEGRRFVGADRVSVLVAGGRALRVRAISGVDNVDRRSPDVILVRKLAKAVALFGEPLWTQNSTALPPQIQQLLDTYQDSSGVRCLAVIPIKPESSDGNSRMIGVLVAEQFKRDEFEAAERDRLAISLRHAKTALSNALEMNSLPLLWVSRGMRWVGRLFGFQSLTKFALFLVTALFLIGAGFAALCLVTVDFTITARGHLQPVHQQDIFAPADGVVQEVLARDGDEVSQGATLVELRNTELDYETDRLQGDLATTEANLLAVQAARVLAGRDRQLTAQHNAEIERLKQIMVGMKRQREILDRQHHDLHVRAPFAGWVVSWETDKALASRPVRQGQRLMTIADVQGPWHLEVEVPDEEIGHVLRARESSEDGMLPVTFVLLTDPAEVHRGRIAEVALATVVAGNREPAVQATVQFDSRTLDAPRPGAGVVARIYCGRRSIGYVWFRGVFEKLRMHTMH